MNRATVDALAPTVGDSGWGVKEEADPTGHLHPLVIAAGSLGGHGLQQGSGGQRRRQVSSVAQDAGLSPQYVPPVVAPVGRATTLHLRWTTVSSPIPV